MTIESSVARAITIYLLTSEVTDGTNAVEFNRVTDLESLAIDSGPDWLLFIRNTKRKRPDWTSSFRGALDLDRFREPSSVSALLLVPFGERLWAITFGYGRFLLREGVIEDRFGLRTALNAIDPDKVRSIDKETFDSFAAQARQQATADTNFLTLASTSIATSCMRSLAHRLTNADLATDWRARMRCVHQSRFGCRICRSTWHW